MNEECFLIVLSICLSVEVLLDMKASGGELGWLPWPHEEGVSSYILK